ncbi:MAG: hypothetical protein ABIC36_02090 [bacterium]
MQNPVKDAICYKCKQEFVFAQSMNKCPNPFCDNTDIDITKWAGKKGKETPLSEHNLLQNPTGDKQLTLFAL